jgi:hypothetical protein
MMLYTIGFILPINDVRIDAGIVQNLTELKDIIYTMIADEMYERTYDGPFETYTEYKDSLLFEDAPYGLEPIIVSYKENLQTVEWIRFMIDNDELMVYYYELFGKDDDEEEEEEEEEDIEEQVNEEQVNEEQVNEEQVNEEQVNEEQVNEEQ